MVPVSRGIHQDESRHMDGLDNPQDICLFFGDCKSRDCFHHVNLGADSLYTTGPCFYCLDGYQSIAAGIGRRADTAERPHPDQVCCRDRISPYGLTIHRWRWGCEEDLHGRLILSMNSVDIFVKAGLAFRPIAVWSILERASEILKGYRVLCIGAAYITTSGCQRMIVDRGRTSRLESNSC